MATGSGSAAGDGAFTSPDFIKDLESKALSCYFDAPQFNSATKARRSKWIMRDRAFRAIANCRQRGWEEQIVQQYRARPKHDYTSADEDTKQRVKWLVETCEDISQRLSIPPYPEDEKVLALEFTNAVKQGDIARLKDLVSLCDLYEKKMWPPKERQSDPKSWYYYTGIAAAGFLKRGVIPTKKQLKEQALRECALAEFSISVPINRWRTQLDSKLDQMRRLLPGKRTWTRIFKHLDLSNLPPASTY
jgi:hypothetical protein